MSELTFVVTGAPLPANFRGDPQAFYEAMLARIRVRAPFGITGLTLNPTVLPSSDKGPVLYNRTWYIWNPATNQYEPQDISTSIVPTSEFSDVQPTDPDILTWYQTSGGTLINVWIKVSGQFQPLFPTSGTTAQRPGAPRPYQQYYDTDIECMIWWERNAWRTVDGCKGDTKFVVWPTAAQALQRNPGWAIVGASTLANNPVWCGRSLVQASQNSDLSNALQVSAGVTRRSPGEVFGAEQVNLTADMLEHVHAVGSWGNISNDDVMFIHRDAGDNPGPVTLPALETKQIQGSGGGPEGTRTEFDIMTSLPVESAGDPIPIVQPSLALWFLVKE